VKIRDLNNQNSMNQDSIIDQIFNHFQLRKEESDELKVKVRELILKNFILNIFGKLSATDKGFLQSLTEGPTQENQDRFAEILAKPEYQEDHAEAIKSVISELLEDEKIVSPEKKDTIYNDLETLLESAQIIAEA